jgi:hypothetical protein
MTKDDLQMTTLFSMVVLAGCAVAAAQDSAPGSGPEANPPPALEAAGGAGESAASEPVIESATDSVVIPPGRPAWVAADPDSSGAVHTIPVASGPYARDADARRALDQALVKETREYLAEQLGSPLAAQLLAYDAAAIKQRLIKPENLYHDIATYSVGPMNEHFALLEFDAAFRKEVESKWTKVRAASRLGQMGLFAGAALLLVASIFSYFRLDNATRGYYTGRLQLLTAVAILAIVGAGAILARWVHWL